MRNRFISIFLSLAIVLSVLSAGFFEVTAYAESVTYYFLAPEEFLKVNDNVGYYYWTPKENAPWPGLAMTPAPEVGKNVYKCSVPDIDSTNRIVFNSYVDAGNPIDPTLYDVAPQTIVIDLEGYSKGESKLYDAIDNFYEMIYVLSDSEEDRKNNEFSGAIETEGEWFSIIPNDDNYYKNYLDTSGEYYSPQRVENPAGSVSDNTQSNKKYHKGDIVTATLRMGNIKIAGEDAKLAVYNYTINFDPDFLEYKSSKKYTSGVSESTVFNPQTDYVRIAAMSYSGMDQDYSGEKNNVCSVSFIVKDDTDNLDISGKCSELLAVDMYNANTSTLIKPDSDTEDIYTELVISAECSHLVTDPDSFSWELNDDDTVTITGYSGSETTVVIPDKIDGKKVTALGYFSFVGNNNITSVVIPDTVTDLMGEVFEDCTSLTSVTLPNSVTNIGKEAFYNCSSLESITIPESVETIGEYVFCKCSALKSIKIPKNVKTIGKVSFAYCENLTSIVIDPGNENYAAENGFLLNKDRTELIACYAGNGALTVPDSVTNMYAGAFMGRTGITDVTIPLIGENIEEKMFEGCVSLKSVTIPGSVRSIGYNTFKNCTSLKDVYFDGNEMQWKDIRFEEGNDLLNKAEIHFAVEANIDYKYEYDGYDSVTITKYIGSGTEVIIPDKIDGRRVTSIGESAFENCDNITQITIPDGVTSIGKLAFMDCKSLKSITLPDSITDIGECAFDACSSLESVAIPKGVTRIEKQTFCWCSALSSVTIPDSVTYIGDGAFERCTSLTNITIPDSVTEICFSAFNNTGLTSIIIPDNITIINNSVFNDCKSLTSIEIPYRVTQIGDYAFAGCTNLSSVTIPESVTKIGASAFNACKGLTDVYYNSSKENWNSIEIDNFNNDYLKNANIHYMTDSETDTDTSTEENLVTYYFLAPKEFLLTNDKTGYYYWWPHEVAPWPGAEMTKAPEIGEYVYKCRVPDQYETSGLVFNSFDDSDGTEVTIYQTETVYLDGYDHGDSKLYDTLDDFYGMIYVLSATPGEKNWYTGEWFSVNPDDDNYYKNYLDKTGRFYTLDADSQTEVDSDNSDTDTDSSKNTETDTQTDTGTDSSKNTETDTRTDTGTDSSKNTETDTRTDTGTDSSKNTETDTQTDTGTDSSKNTETDTRNDTGTDSSKNTETDTRTDTGTDSSENTETDTNTDTGTDSSENTETDNEPPVTPPEDFVYDLVGDTITIKLYKGNDTVITIPSEIRGIPVTKITKSPNDKNDSITRVKKIYIPDSLTTIGGNAFSDYTALEKVVIPDSVTVIDANAFAGCTSLTGIDIPESVTTIGTSSFSHCTNLKSIVLPNSIEDIGMSAFFKCESLTEIAFPEKVTSIKGNMFNGCQNLKTVTIPKSVTEIGSGVFGSCQNLTDIYYGGNEARWSTVQNDSKNSFMQLATIHFNPDDDFKLPEDIESQDQPDKPDLSKLLLGDVDGDGKISAKDSLTIQRYVIHLRKLDDTQLTAADADGDGKVSNKDALDILRYTIHMSKNDKIGKPMA